MVVVVEVEVLREMLLFSGGRELAARLRGSSSTRNGLARLLFVAGDVAPPREHRWNIKTHLLPKTVHVLCLAKALGPVRELLLVKHRTHRHVVDELRGNDETQMNAGDVFVIKTPGGGGFGKA